MFDTELRKPWGLPNDKMEVPVHTKPMPVY